MNLQELQTNAQAIVAPGEGLLAADESTSTAGKRLDTVGLENNEENRRRYRNIFFSMPGFGDYISGVILFEETMGHATNDGTPFMEVLKSEGVMPGIKVDQGAKPMEDSPDEFLTSGLEGLPERMAAYYEQGARFAKWRAVIVIDEAKGLPTDDCVSQNADALAKYAKICQEAGIVPVIEPEVLYDKGVHSIEVAEQVTTRVIKETFDACTKEGVELSGLILKSSMVLASKEFETPSTPGEVAEATLRCFKNSVPEEVPGIVFLSGGQSAEDATVHLNEINKTAPHPWEISFSYGRGLQGEALAAWAGDDANIPAAQEAFKTRLEKTQKARNGEY